MYSGIGIIKITRRLNWEARGVENLKSLQEPVVFAANHVSHVDTPAILGTLPRHLRRRTVVAAALDVFGTNGDERPSLGKRILPTVVAAAFHAFAFDRHGPPMRSVRTSVQLIRDGSSLLLYPEGTRSRTSSFGEFKSGVAVLARFTKRPVVPVFVHGGRRVLPCGAFMPRPGRIRVHYGVPLYHDQNESAADFTSRLEQAIYSLRRHRTARSTAPTEPALDPIPAS
jgi:1-acyl-sn-glycerol-3-phosphate acyltransferase